MIVNEKEIIMIEPDNWHVHPREGWLMPLVIETLIRYGWRSRIVAMGNTKDLIKTGPEAKAYQNKILEIAQQIPGGDHFEPIVAIVVNKHSTVDIIREAVDMGFVTFKLYPKNMTTNSEHGIETSEYMDICRMFEKAKVMTRRLHHGESPNLNVKGIRKEKAYHDIFRLFTANLDGEDVFEHITDADTVEFVKSFPVGRVGATITVHHMLLTQDHILGYHPASKFLMQPHWHNKPTPKFEEDRRALINAATSGDPHFFCGNDDAFHPVSAKECEDVCAGCANTLAALPLLLDIFITAGKTENTEKFCCHNGADFYGYKRNTRTIKILFERSKIASMLYNPAYPFPVDDSSMQVKPFMAGQEVPFTVEYNT